VNSTTTIRSGWREAGETNVHALFLAQSFEMTTRCAAIGARNSFPFAQRLMPSSIALRIAFKAAKVVFDSLHIEMRISNWRGNQDALPTAKR
jgi:hypothetical protein